MGRTGTPSFLGPHIDTDRVPLLVHCTWNSLSFVLS